MAFARRLGRWSRCLPLEASLLQLSFGLQTITCAHAVYGPADYIPRTPPPQASELGGMHGLLRSDRWCALVCCRKNLAMALAIILSCLASVPMFGFKPNGVFAGGATLVIASIFLYNLGPAAKKPPPPETKADSSD